MSEGATNRHSISCELLHETAAAWLLDDGTKEFWFPKSQGELYKRADSSYDLFAEEWLLKKKGLI